MTSSELTIARNSFSESLDNFVTNYDEIKSQINAMNRYLTESSDTLLNRFLYAENSKIIEYIDIILNAINNNKTSIIATINSRITELEGEDSDETR